MNWTDITGSIPPEPADAVAVDPNATTVAYVGTDYGIFENANVWSGTTWSSVQYNLPAVAIDKIAFNVSNGNLRVATHGRGIWELGGSTAPIVNASTGWQQNLTNSSGALGSSVLMKFWEVGGASAANSGTVSQSSTAAAYSTGYKVGSNWGAAGVSGVPSSTSARTAVLLFGRKRRIGPVPDHVHGAVGGPVRLRYRHQRVVECGRVHGDGNAPCSVSIPNVIAGTRAPNDANGKDYTVSWTPLSNLEDITTRTPGATSSPESRSTTQRCGRTDGECNGLRHFQRQLGPGGRRDKSGQDGVRQLGIVRQRSGNVDRLHSQQRAGDDLCGA